MTVLPYEKRHGTGNDFVVVDADAHDVPVADRGRFAARVCDRQRGVGADGVLFLSVVEASPLRVVMDHYQPDGDPVEMCGNGARVAARWAAERTGETTFDLLTGAGVRRATVGADLVTVEMDRPRFAPADVPVDADAPFVDREVAGWVVTAVNTGVPHAVCWVEDVQAIDLDAMAPAVRYADVFPEGANVTLAAARADGGFDQRSYERGVEGETQACGTGATAIVAVAERAGRAPRGEWVAVHPPGGELGVRIDADGTASLRGPTVHEFDGELDLDEVFA